MVEALRRGNLRVLGQLCSCIIVKEGHTQAVLHQGQIEQASSSITTYRPYYDRLPTDHLVEGVAWPKSPWPLHTLTSAVSIDFRHHPISVAIKNKDARKTFRTKLCGVGGTCGLTRQPLANYVIGTMEHLLTIITVSSYVEDMDEPTTNPSVPLLIPTFVDIQLLEYSTLIMLIDLPAYFPPGKHRCHFF